MNRTSVLVESVADPLAFSVTEVTGLKSLEVDSIDGHREAADVARSMASLLDLPSNTTPYSLRDDASARMLADDLPLGGQIPSTGARLVVIPKSHLG